MKIVYCILFACLFVLIGTGLQYFVYGLTVFQTVDFNDYNIWNWIFQSIYWIVLICWGIIAGNSFIDQ